jgi:hypothetical protein
MSKLEKVVSGKVNSIFVKRLIKENGWTKQHAASLVVEFVTGGTKLNFKEFMEAGGQIVDTPKMENLDQKGLSLLYLKYTRYRDGFSYSGNPVSVKEFYERGMGHG